MRHFLRVDWAPNPYDPPDTNGWPFTIPAVSQLIQAGGFEIPDGITILVGENGSGKSTLVEALAATYPRPGFVSPYHTLAGASSSAEDAPLPKHLRARVAPWASPAGFFLRAESMHAYFSRLDADPSQRRAWGGERLQERSHGESFLTVLRHRFADLGVYFLDEPEAALSFQSCLGLLAQLDVMRREGSQVFLATHSPLLVTLPGATLLEIGEWGVRQVHSYRDLDLVQHWRSYLDSPERYLRHLLDD